MRSRVLLALLVCDLACAGGSPPFLISVTDSSGFAVLSWEPAGGPVDFYAIDWRDAGNTGAPFTQITRDAVSVQLSTLPFDVSDFEFRVRAEPGARASNGVVFHRGTGVVAAPDVTGPSSGAFVVQYMNPSQTSQIRLERSTNQQDGTSGPWLQVDAGSARINTYTDRDLSQWVDGARYQYRASVGASSPSVSSSTAPAPLLAPALVGFTLNANGAVLLITNSRYAKSISLYRGNALLATIAAAPPGQSVQFIDQQLSAGLWRYQLQAFTAGQTLTSPTATFWEVVPLPSPTMLANIIDVQQGVSAVRDASGRFGVVNPLVNDAFVNSGVAAYPPGGDVSSALILRVNVQLTCQLDAAGHPHTAWYTAPQTPGAAGPVYHAWHDGTRWQTEQIAQRTFSSTSTAFDVGLDGTLFAAWISEAGVELATRAGGAWSVQLVAPATQAIRAGEVLVSGDELGSPHLIVVSPYPGIHYFQASGGWQSEPVPYSNPAPDAGMRVFAGFGRIDIAAITYGFAQVELVTRTASGWATPLALTSAHGMSAARSVDGKAIALAASDGNLWILRNGALVRKAFLPAFDSTARTAVGFGATGKAWVLEWLGDPYTLTPASLVSPSLPGPAAVFDER